jgi:2,3,4,5-tetrahydropyridine-2,6-dicarboxylate N-succinyltransferase
MLALKTNDDTCFGDEAFTEAISDRQIKAVIDKVWREGADAVAPELLHEVLAYVLASLDAGRLRAAERQSVGRWRVNEWVMRAVVLSYGLNDSKLTRAGDISYFDKVDSKFAGLDEAEMRSSGVRTVQPAMVCYGSYLGNKVIVMPSFVHMGAYIDEGSTVDGWVNVGTCAQIGKRVHLSVGVCIGGVFEPAQERPVIVEDDCFIGTHSSIVEGVVVEEGAVIGMGVHLGRSTKIFDRATGAISYGRVPAGSVVIPGMLPAGDGSYFTSCAVIVKQVDAATRAKTSINAMLRAAA